MEYVPVLFKQGNSHASSPYQGFPTDETDRLWQELYGGKRVSHRLDAAALTSSIVGTFIHVDEDAGSRLLNTSIKAPVVGSENDLMVGLDVFHQLHCLVGARSKMLSEIGSKAYTGSRIKFEWPSIPGGTTHR